MGGSSVAKVYATRRPTCKGIAYCVSCMRNCTPPSLSLATIQREGAVSPLPAKISGCAARLPQNGSSRGGWSLRVARWRRKRYTLSKPPYTRASRASNTMRRGSLDERAEVDLQGIAERVITAIEARRHTLGAINNDVARRNVQVVITLNSERRVELGEIAIDDVHEVRGPTDHVQESRDLHREIDLLDVAELGKQPTRRQGDAAEDTELQGLRRAHVGEGARGKE